MATFSANTTIKMVAAVSASGSAPATMFTVPAGQYAILNVCTTSASGGGTVTVGGALALNLINATLNNNFGTIYAGPSQAVVIAFAGSCNWGVSGVTFTNSP